MLKMGNATRPLLVALLVAFFSPYPCLASWWQTATFYQIFVRSFQDSNDDGSGDIEGIKSRLDHLTSLGIGGLCLTPVFPSPSYHGYDATDFTSINPGFGTMKDFRNLVSEAHQRGIKIVIDIAINFTSDQHAWFKDAVSSPSSKYRDWYLWRSTPPSWGKWYRSGEHFYYSVFDRSMPHLNWRNPNVMTAFKEVLLFWMKQGVDGFRMDAARYYVPGPNGENDTPETHRVLAELGDAVRSEYPGVLFVGEVWADVNAIHSYSASGKELDLAFNFPLAFSLVNTLNSEDAGAFGGALTEFKNSYGNQKSTAPFLTNHDMDRLASTVGSYDPKIRLAAEINFMLPGTPFVYYGEEIGLPNGKSKGDLAKRVPMPWNDFSGFGFTSGEPWQPFLGKAEKYSVAVQEENSGSLLNLYRKLIHLRNETPLLSLGKLDHIHSQGPGVMSWLRRHQEKTALVVVNFGRNPSAAFKLNPAVGPLHIASVLYGGTVEACEKYNQSEIPGLPPYSTRVFLLE